MDLTRRVLFSAKQTKILFKHLSTNPPGLLRDVNVLDMSRIVAGPYCGMLMGDLGANVIKVESLEGDEARRFGPPFIPGTRESIYFLSVNRNKKSICVDMKSLEGKQIIHEMAKKCDVVIENFLPGKLDKLGVGYQTLRQHNPKIIYCAVTGFGPSGPYANKPGYDVIAAGMGGLLHCTGSPGGRPVKPAVAITDLTTGLHAFGAIMAALHHRHSTGQGQKIDCNLLSTQVASMFNLATTYLNCGTEPQRWGTAHASIVPYQGFQTKDGEIIIGTGSDAQFNSFCKYINREDLLQDNRFKTNYDRVANREVLLKIIEDVIKTKTKKEWVEIFKDAPFPNGPINSLKELFEDEHVKAIGLVKEMEHPELGDLKLVGPPTVYSEAAYPEPIPPPTLGQHTKEILSKFLGYEDDRINRLMDGRVIR